MTVPAAFDVLSLHPYCGFVCLSLCFNAHVLLVRGCSCACHNRAFLAQARTLPKHHLVYAHSTSLTSRRTSPDSLVRQHGGRILRPGSADSWQRAACRKESHAAESAKEARTCISWCYFQASRQERKEIQCARSATSETQHPQVDDPRTVRREGAEPQIPIEPSQCAEG